MASFSQGDEKYAKIGQERSSGKFGVLAPMHREERRPDPDQLLQRVREEEERKREGSSRSFSERLRA